MEDKLATPITLEELQQWSLYFAAVFTDEGGSPICSICNSLMLVGDGLEPSPACNTCVQEFIDQQLPRLLKLAREAVSNDHDQHRIRELETEVKRARERLLKLSDYTDDDAEQKTLIECVDLAELEVNCEYEQRLEFEARALALEKELERVRAAKVRD